MALWWCQNMFNFNLFVYYCHLTTSTHDATCLPLTSYLLHVDLYNVNGPSDTLFGPMVTYFILFHSFWLQIPLCHHCTNNATAHLPLAPYITNNAATNLSLTPTSSSSTSTVQTAQMTCPDMSFGPIVFYFIFVLFILITDAAMLPPHQRRRYSPPTHFLHHLAPLLLFKRLKRCVQTRRLGL